MRGQTGSVAWEVARAQQLSALTFEMEPGTLRLDERALLDYTLAKAGRGVREL